MAITSVNKSQIKGTPFDNSTGHSHSGASENGPKIPVSSISDIAIATPADGDMLKYSTSQSKWVNFVPSSSDPTTFFAKITGHSAGTVVKWTYTFVEVEQATAAGYDSVWNVVSGGRSGDCFNFTEYINDISLVAGNGVNLPQLVVDFPYMSIVPCPDDNLVVMKISICANSDTQYWFEYSNSIDGGCE